MPNWVCLLVSHHVWCNHCVRPNAKKKKKTATVQTNFYEKRRVDADFPKLKIHFRYYQSVYDQLQYKYCIELHNYTTVTATVFLSDLAENNTGLVEESTDHGRHFQAHTTICPSHLNLEAQEKQGQRHRNRTQTQTSRFNTSAGPLRFCSMRERGGKGRGKKAQ